MRDKKRKTARAARINSNRPQKPAEKPQGQKRVRPSHTRSYNIATPIIFLILSIYLIGYLISFINKPSIPVESVSIGSIDVPQSYDGIIVRDEYVIKTDIEGQPSFNFADNDRIKKATVVASIIKGGDVSSIEGEIAKIDKEIINAQKNRSDISIFNEDILRIENNIHQDIDNSVIKFAQGSFSDVYSLKQNIEAQMGLRTQIWLTENIKSQEELNLVKNQYQNQLNESLANITAPESGIFSLAIDSFEQAFSPETINSITKEQITMKTEVSYVSKTSELKADEPVCKIVKSNTWYLCSYVPNDVAAKWELNSRKVIINQSSDEKNEVEMRIMSMRQEEKETYVVFETERDILSFIDLRNISFSVKDTDLTGLKVPNSAIGEKIFLKIPSGYIIENEGEKGIIRKNGEQESFTPLAITKDDGEFAFVRQDFDIIRLGDSVVKKNGDVSESYSISEVFTFKGVYVSNSSYAHFTIIDIIDQNEEYSIVDANTTYGLKVYDKIVSNAQGINEGDEIY